MSTVTDVSSVFAAFLQIVNENSSGTTKLKIVEYGGDKPFEGIFLPNIISILESEPLIFVSLKFKTFKKKHIYNN